MITPENLDCAVILKTGGRTHITSQHFYVHGLEIGSIYLKKVGFVVISTFLVITTTHKKQTEALNEIKQAFCNWYNKVELDNINPEIQEL